MKSWLSVHTQIRAAPQVVVGDLRLTPRSKVVEVRVPFGAFMWNRPTDIEVVNATGEAAHIAVVDLTRRLQMLLWASVLAMSLVALIERRNRT